MLNDLRRDFRFALRMLVRTPGLTFVIGLTLALGIGAVATIFSAVDAVLLRSAPVSNPRTLASVYTASADGRDPFSSSSYPITLICETAAPSGACRLLQHRAGARS